MMNIIFENKKKIRKNELLYPPPSFFPVPKQQATNPMIKNDDDS
jgi:hypothetical protein